MRHKSKSSWTPTWAQPCDLCGRGTREPKTSLCAVCGNMMTRVMFATNRIREERNAASHIDVDEVPVSYRRFNDPHAQL